MLELFGSKSLEYMGSNYVVEDESWFLWSQTYKGKVWIRKNSVKPKNANVKSKLTNQKTMGLIAFTCKPKRFLVAMMPSGSTIDANLMI